MGQWYIARLALAFLAFSSASDAAPSSFAPRFQRPGGSSLIFGHVCIPVGSESLLSDSLCTRLIGFCLEI